MSQSAAIGPGPATLSGVLRIALFEDDDVAARASFVSWPGERVETKALLMPASPTGVSPVTITTVDHAFVPPAASEPLVTIAAVWAALLAVVVMTAGAAAMALVVALLLFR